MSKTARPPLAAIACIAVILAIVTSACSGGSGARTTVRTIPVPEGSPASPTSTGIVEVDHLIEAAESGDVIELAALTGYQHIACDPDAEDGSDAPKCRESESSGDEVEVLASSGCERQWVRPEQVPETYRAALAAGGVTLFAVYEPNDTADPFGEGFGAQYVIVLLSGKRDDGPAEGVALHVKAGRVVWLERACAQALELVSAARVRSFIVAPAGVTVASTPTASAQPAPTAEN
jgi:hypothetical protein